MDRNDLKKVLKPLIKQCIKEVILEEGVLSNIVSEVVVGLAPMLTENRNGNATQERTEKLLEEQHRTAEEEKWRMLKEQKRKVLDATGFGSEIFEDVEPIPTGGSLNDSSPPGTLSGVDPKDPGVDISGIMAVGAHKWNKLV
tara:strand:+ start:10017 stop:10442 length:426 start_codon:yes stop_codon:yes gene_type:complete